MDKFALIDYLPDVKLKILDYRCGNGELSYFLARHNKNWLIIGYDEIPIIAQTLTFYTKTYPRQLEPPNVIFQEIEKADFDVFDYVLYSDALKPKIKSTNFLQIKR